MNPTAFRGVFPTKMAAVSGTAAKLFFLFVP
jgi:hypothetical protein